MADSDSDAAFESADEGEEVANRKETPSKHKKRGPFTQKAAGSPVKESVIADELASKEVKNEASAGSVKADVKSPVEEIEKKSRIETTPEVQTVDPTDEKAISVEHPEEGSDNETIQEDNTFQSLPPTETKAIDSVITKDSGEVDEMPKQEESEAAADVSNHKSDLKSTKEEIPLVEDPKSAESMLNSLSDSNKKVPESSGWGWNSWSASLLSTATSSVSSFTSQVGQGFSTVLETVETTLGAPPPEELAVLQKDAKESAAEENDSQGPSEKLPESSSLLNISGLLSGVSVLSNVIESTGTKVLSSGLDTLELLGKKTMDVLQEGDPGLKKKRALFQGNKPNLSQVLKDAKIKAEEEKLMPEQSESQTPDFLTLFDEYHGLIHLEALEMLSKQSECTLSKLCSLLDSEQKVFVDEIKEKAEESFNLEDVDDLDDEEDDHEFTELVSTSLSELQIGATPVKILEAQKKIRDWLKTCEEEQKEQGQKGAQEIHLYSFQSLVEITAKTIEQFHKISELLLLPDNDVTEGKIESISRFSRTICAELHILSRKFSQCLNTAADDSEDPDSVKPLITNVFLTASDSSTYVQDALLLLIPVLQANITENLLKS